MRPPPALALTIITASASGWLPQLSFITKMPKRINKSICTRAVSHLAKDRAEQIGAFAGGGGQQPAQGALLPFVGEHGRDADQRDEDPGDQLPGRRIGARVIFDRVDRVALNSVTRLGAAESRVWACFRASLK